MLWAELLGKMLRQAVSRNGRRLRKGACLGQGGRQARVEGLEADCAIKELGIVAGSPRSIARGNLGNMKDFRHNSLSDNTIGLGADVCGVEPIRCVVALMWWPGSWRCRVDRYRHMPPARHCDLHLAEEESELSDHPDARDARRGVDQHAHVASYTRSYINVPGHALPSESLDQPVEEAELATRAAIGKRVEWWCHRSQPARIGGDLAVVCVLAGLLAGQAPARPLEAVLHVADHAGPQPSNVLHSAILELRREAPKLRHSTLAEASSSEVVRNPTDAQPRQEEAVAGGPEVVDAGVVHGLRVALPGLPVKALRDALEEVRDHGPQLVHTDGVVRKRGAAVDEVGQWLRVELCDAANRR